VTWAALKPWLIMALIFGVGMVAGGSLVIAFHPGAPLNPPGEQQIRAHWMMHLTHRLHLTPDQEAKIEPIIADAVNHIQAQHDEEVGKFGQIMDAANEKIALILTPDQQAMLKKMMSERPHEFPGRPHPWEGPGPGPGAGFPHDGQPPGAPPVAP